MDELQERLKVSFRNRALLRESMTHASWNNERGEHGKDNERLEYLGDAVLELVTGEYLFRRFPTYDEGQLTQMRSSLVNTQALAKLGEQLQLGESLRLGRGAAKTGARRLTSLLANAFEALIGAIFLDQGYRVAGRVFLSRIGDVSDWTDTNFKGRLQALAQERFGAAPQYRVTAVPGPGHGREYLAQAVTPTDPDRVLGEGRGGTKQAAEQIAARNAIDQMTAPVSRPRRARRTRGPAGASESLAVAEPLVVPAADAGAEAPVVGPEEEPSPPRSRRGHRGGRRRSGRAEAGDAAEAEDAAPTAATLPVAPSVAAPAAPEVEEGAPVAPARGGARRRGRRGGRARGSGAEGSASGSVEEGAAVAGAAEPAEPVAMDAGMTAAAGEPGAAAAPARSGARRRGRRGGRARGSGAEGSASGSVEEGAAVAGAAEPAEPVAMDAGMTAAAGDPGAAAAPARSGTHRRGRRGGRARAAGAEGPASGPAEAGAAPGAAESEGPAAAAGEPAAAAAPARSGAHRRGRRGGRMRRDPPDA